MLAIVWTGCRAVGAFAFVPVMLGKSIRHVLIDTVGSFRAFVVAINVLCDDVSSYTFCFGVFFPVRTNDGIVVMYEAAAVGA